RLQGGPAQTVLYVILVIVVTSPIWYFLSTAAYRVGGGRGDLCIFDDRIEIPGSRRVETIVLPAQGVSLACKEIRVRYRLAGIPVAERSAGRVLTLISQGQKRVLSSKAFRMNAGLLASWRTSSVFAQAGGRSGQESPIEYQRLRAATIPSMPLTKLSSIA